MRPFQKVKSIWRVMNRYAGEICDGFTESECGKPSHSNSSVEEMKHWKTKTCSVCGEYSRVQKYSRKDFDHKEMEGSR